MTRGIDITTRVLIRERQEGRVRGRRYTCGNRDQKEEKMLVLKVEGEATRLGIQVASRS